MTPLFPPLLFSALLATILVSSRTALAVTAATAGSDYNDDHRDDVSAAKNQRKNRKFTHEEMHLLRREAMHATLESLDDASSFSSPRELRSYYYLHASIVMATSNAMTMSSGHVGVDADEILETAMTGDGLDVTFLQYVEKMLEGSLAEARRGLEDDTGMHGSRDAKGEEEIPLSEEEGLIIIDMLDGDKILRRDDNGEDLRGEGPNSIVDDDDRNKSQVNHSREGPIITNDTSEPIKGETEYDAPAASRIIFSNNSPDSHGSEVDVSAPKDENDSQERLVLDAINVKSEKENDGVDATTTPDTADDANIDDADAALKDATPEARLRKLIMREYTKFRCDQYPPHDEILPAVAEEKWKELKRHFWKFAVDLSPPEEDYLKLYITENVEEDSIDITTDEKDMVNNNSKSDLSPPEEDINGDEEDYRELYVDVITEEVEEDSIDVITDENDMGSNNIYSNNSTTAQQQHQHPKAKKYGLFAWEGFYKGEVVYSQKSSTVFFLQDFDLWRRFLHSLLPDTESACLAMEWTFKKKISYPGRWMLGLVLDEGAYMRSSGSSDEAEEEEDGNADGNKKEYNVAPEDEDDTRGLDLVAIRDIKPGEEIIRVGNLF